MTSASISSFLKGATEWLFLIRSTPSTSSTITSTVADDIEMLERTLERIKAVLVDAEKRDILDESIKLWLKEIKDVAYDAEDLLDEYRYEVLRTQVENRKRKRDEGEVKVMPLASSASKISILISMADRIKKVRQRLDEISKHRHDLHLKAEDGQRRRDSSSHYPSETSHMVNEQEIYGRDFDKEKLTDWLFSDTESKFEALAVVGKGGLGKTTLAQLVYNDKNVSEYFKTRMWICVSDDFNLTRLTRAMIESITMKSCTSSDQLSPLQKSLYKELRGRRVLLVLDDVWNENKGLWESLSIPFQGAEIVRIIVTARNESAAEIMQTTKPYHLGYLPEDQGWQLFLCRAFRSRDPEQFPLMVEIGKKIVKKCNGLPLAVKSLGGLLQHEMDEDKWNDVLHSKLWDNKTDVLPALLLSYICMPSHLKPCFEIYSAFPKDHEFSKDELVNLWAAHGYIRHDNGEKNDAREIGYTYFNELHRRSFFDEFNKYPKGIYKRRMRSFFDDIDKYGKTLYKMHDNIHEVAQYVQVGMDLSNSKIRHLSTTNNSLEFPLDDIGTLRTLIIPLQKIAINGVLGGKIAGLKHLRYLYIKRYWLGDQELLLPDALRNLICLRHLELYTINDMKVPKSIGELYNLVVLKITCHRLVELPETLRNLMSLTTIYFMGFRNDRLPALGQLPSLKSLYLIELGNVKSIGNEFYRGGNNSHAVAFRSLTSLVFKDMTSWEKWDELQEGDFPQLQKIEINCCRWLSELKSLSHMGRKDCSSLQVLPVLPKLKTLDNFYGRKLSLPQRFGELKTLERLTGRFSVGIDDVFGILKNLVRLKHLILSNACSVNFKFHEQKEVLHLIVKSDSKDASFSLLKNLLPDTLPNLSSLTTIYFRGFLNDQLPALGQLPSLKSLTLKELDNVKSIGNEFCRVRNKRQRVAFPSLTSLLFEDMSNWEKWDELQVGDFPQLQKLEILRCRRLSSLPSLANLSLLWHMRLNKCDLLLLSPDGSFPANLKSLQNSRHLELSLRQGFGELKKLERLSGLFCVRFNNLFVILKNLASLEYMIVSKLRNAHSAWNDEACLKEYCGTEKLVLNWYPPSEVEYSFDGDKDLQLVVEKEQSNQTKKESFFVMDKLQPHTNLEELYIIGYEGVEYPTWISHPSFDRLNRVHLRNCEIEQLPTLGQLPSLKHLHLHSIYCLKRIGDEFCRGINGDPSHDAVAFPSLINLVFEGMYSLEEWYGVRRGDFPKLEDLSIHNSPRLSSLYSCSAKRLHLENLKVILRVRNDQLFGTLKSLPLNTTKLTMTILRNARGVMKAEAYLERQSQLGSLTLKWNTDDDDANISSLRLVVEDDDDEDGTNIIENASFFVLEKLQPHINLVVLNINGSDGVGYPMWIGHPSFHRLTYINLHDCTNEQLPTLGQLPSLVGLCLDLISGLKRIGNEFCRDTMMNSEHDNLKVGFPSLINLQFKHMHDWEEWYGVLGGDFPKLEELIIEDCLSLRKDLDSFPQRLLKYL